MIEKTKKINRSGGRAGNSRRIKASTITQKPWHIPSNPDTFIEPVSEEDVEKIYNNIISYKES